METKQIVMLMDFENLVIGLENLDICAHFLSMLFYQVYKMIVILIAVYVLFPYPEKIKVRSVDHQYLHFLSPFFRLQGYPTPVHAAYPEQLPLPGLLICCPYHI